MKKNFLNGAHETALIFVDELRLIFTDAGAVLLFVIAMVIYPLLYAVGYEKETIRDIPVAVVDLDNTSSSRLYSRMADATEQMHVNSKPASIREAENLYFNGMVKGVILIPAGFERDLFSLRQATVSVYCDASNFLLYKQVFSGASFANGNFGAGVEVKRMLSEGKPVSQAMDMQEPLRMAVYNLYNPAGGYGSFVMPGIILLIMQQTLLIGIGMLGGTIREKNIFLKMNAKARHHIGSVQLVVGKATAYTLVYLVNAVFALGLLHRWFHYPSNNSFFTMLILFIPYMLSISFMGLAISMFFKERVHSMLFMVFLSPMVVFLSGISWPASAIPPALYGVAHLFPSTLAVPAYLKLRIAGASMHAIQPEMLKLIFQLIIYFILAVLSYHYALKRFGKRIGRKL